jgi:hypothetical protein
VSRPWGAEMLPPSESGRHVNLEGRTIKIETFITALETRIARGS